MTIGAVINFRGLRNRVLVGNITTPVSFFDVARTRGLVSATITAPWTIVDSPRLIDYLNRMAPYSEMIPTACAFSDAARTIV